jgi:hypothetical protein
MVSTNTLTDTSANKSNLIASTAYLYICTLYIHIHIYIFVVYCTDMFVIESNLLFQVRSASTACSANCLAISIEVRYRYCTSSEVTSNPAIST